VGGGRGGGGSEGGGGGGGGGAGGRGAGCRAASGSLPADIHVTPEWFERGSVGQGAGRFDVIDWIDTPELLEAKVTERIWQQRRSAGHRLRT